MKKQALTAYRRFLKATGTGGGKAIYSEHVKAPGMSAIIKQNRDTLSQIPQWVPPDLTKNSVFRYGVNPDIEPLLDLPLDSECTHTDLLVHFGRSLKTPCKYLELGVSVGKTLWLILNNCSPCECWGFDIEELTPVLRKRLVEQSRQEWPSPPNSLKKTPSSISRFIHPKSGSKLTYVCADIFDEKAWELLAGASFNLVLSDALHSAQALEFEWAHLSKTGIFNPEEVVIMWDDLNGEMKTWFQHEQKDIANRLSIPGHQVTTAYINGWLGRREFPHRLGLAMKTAA
jgi:hypothetical protein